MVRLLGIVFFDLGSQNIYYLESTWAGQKKLNVHEIDKSEKEIVQFVSAVSEESKRVSCFEKDLLYGHKAFSERLNPH